ARAMTVLMNRMATAGLPHRGGLDAESKSQKEVEGPAGRSRRRGSRFHEALLVGRNRGRLARREAPDGLRRPLRSVDQGWGWRARTWRDEGMRYRDAKQPAKPAQGRFGDVGDRRWRFAHVQGQSGWMGCGVLVGIRHREVSVPLLPLPAALEPGHTE